MKNIYSVDRAMEVIKKLAENQYSALWDLVEDFEINGHVVSIKNSTQFGHIIVDHAYMRITDGCTLYADGKTYEHPIDYVRDRLSTKKEDK